MTSLIAWVGVDSRGPASVYVASDSRLSKSSAKWDCGRKVFACNFSPDMFGYCGAVPFPSHFLGQLTQSIDAGLIFPKAAIPDQRLQILSERISDAAPGFPEKGDFTIVYATRSGEGFRASFFIATVSWSPNKTTSRMYSIPAASDLVCAFGSGKPVVEEFNFAWKQSEVGRTSRAVFSAFCDAIASGSDKYSGGAPQLVGIYLRGSARNFGIFHNGTCHLNGMRATETGNSNFECRNNLFECCDANGKVIGKRHSRPRANSSNK